MPGAAVKLPTLELKESRLAGAKCGCGVLEVVVDFLRDAVAPVRTAGQGLASLLSGGGLGPQAETALLEEEAGVQNPQNLASRVSRSVQAPGMEAGDV